MGEAPPPLALPGLCPAVALGGGEGEGRVEEGRRRGRLGFPRVALERDARDGARILQSHFG